ncbi:MAG: hypothetical protein QW304_04225 [Thermoproteota archaeon]
MLIFFILTTIHINKSYAAPPPWYAGYALWSPPGGTTPWGIHARIYTISPTVPSGHFLVEWDAIVLSYTNTWWIQTGYAKVPSQFSGLKFYSEKNDTYGHRLNFSSTGPTTGETYSYMICTTQQSPPNRWDILIRTMDGRTLYSARISTNPYRPLDFQAMAEMSTSSIRIDNTHFSELSYYDGRSWPHWWRHACKKDFPYNVQETSNYEFYASGGG